MKASDAEVVSLFTYTMQHSGSELAELSDSQVGNGLKLLLEDGFPTDIGRTIRDADVDIEVKAKAVESLKTLYTNCLALRVKPHMGSLSETGNCAPLDYICYMLWDVSSWMEWPEVSGRETMLPTLIDVMNSALENHNEAVVESGLHGLGHMVSSCPELAGAAIDRFIAWGPDGARPELKQYARQARTGMIL